MSDTVFYFGLLGNVNPSIQQICLHEGLRIEKWSKQKILDFLNQVIAIDPIDAEDRYEDVYGCGAKKTAYVITGSLESDTIPIQAEVENAVSFFLRSHEFYESYSSILENKIHLLRLCSKGDIRLSISCYYRIDESGDKELIQANQVTTSLRNWVFHVSPNEAEYFNDFISTTEIHLQPEYIQLAYENFLLSYDVLDDRLTFLSLMIALETLFNDGTSEIRYRISRGVAVLLGRTIKQSEAIFKDVKRLYNKRSVLVHTGDPRKIRPIDVLDLQNYVRDSLRLLIGYRIPKNLLTQMLTEEGFGAHNRIKKSRRIAGHNQSVQRFADKPGSR